MYQKQKRKTMKIICIKEFEVNSISRNFIRNKQTGRQVVPNLQSILTTVTFTTQTYEKKGIV